MRYIDEFFTYIYIYRYMYIYIYIYFKSLMRYFIHYCVEKREKLEKKDRKKKNSFIFM